MDEESGEVATASVDIDVLQRGQSGELQALQIHNRSYRITHYFTYACTCRQTHI